MDFHILAEYSHSRYIYVVVNRSSVPFPQAPWRVWGKRRSSILPLLSYGVLWR